MNKLVIALSQCWFFRALVGGRWVLMDGVWRSVDVMRIAADDSVFLSYRDINGSHVSFHETYVGIKAHQKFW